MKYSRFEELPVWQSGRELFQGIEVLVRDSAFSLGDLRDQMLRASLSVTNNIAEGFERGTTQELLTFLYYARGSAGETRSMLAVCTDMERFAHLKFEISNLKLLAESIGRQIRGWTDSLQNSEIKGQRFLTGDAADEFQRKQRAKELDARLKAIVAEARPSAARGTLED